MKFLRGWGGGQKIKKWDGLRAHTQLSLFENTKQNEYETKYRTGLQYIEVLHYAYIET